MQLPFLIQILHYRKQEAIVKGFLGLTSGLERLTHIALSMWKLIGLLDTQIILKVKKMFACIFVTDVVFDTSRKDCIFKFERQTIIDI